MTPQEMFNRAYIGVIQQGEAGTRDGNCAYYRLTDNGPVMCGVGHVVGKDTARALAAGQHGALCDIWANTLSECGDDEDDTAEAVSELIGSDVVDQWALADALQEAHDTAHTIQIQANREYTRDGFLAAFKDNMRLVAQTHELTIPEMPDAA